MAASSRDNSMMSRSVWTGSAVVCVMSLCAVGGLVAVVAPQDDERFYVAVPAVFVLIGSATIGRWLRRFRGVAGQSLTLGSLAAGAIILIVLVIPTVVSSFLQRAHREREDRGSRLRREPHVQGTNPASNSSGLPPPGLHSAKPR